MVTECPGNGEVDVLAYCDLTVVENEGGSYTFTYLPSNVESTTGQDFLNCTVLAGMTNQTLSISWIGFS